MEIKKTGKLFSFCSAAPAIIKNKNSKKLNFLKILVQK
jgi:farnesyl diphosphate synthase